MPAPTPRSEIIYLPDTTRKSYSATAIVLDALFRPSRASDEGAEAEETKNFLRLPIVIKDGEHAGESERIDLYTTGGAAAITKANLIAIAGQEAFDKAMELFAKGDEASEDEAQAVLAEAIKGAEILVSVVPQIARHKTNGGPVYNRNGQEIKARSSVNLQTSDKKAGKAFFGALADVE